jgi:hypothetical protein
MKRILTTVFVAAACWVMGGMSGGVQAQSASGGQGGMYGSASSHSSKDNIKLTGCLQSDPSGKGYILTNAAQGTGSSAGEMGSSSASSGTSGSSDEEGGVSGTAGNMGRSVELVPNKNVDLKAHVGHRVEITGMPTGKKGTGEAAGMPGSGGTEGGSGQGGMSGTSGPAGWANQKFRVESLRHIADSCSGQ